MEANTASRFTGHGDVAPPLEWLLQQRDSFGSRKSYEQIALVVFSWGTEGSGTLKSSNSNCFHRPKQECKPMATPLSNVELLQLLIILHAGTPCHVLPCLKPVVPNFRFLHDGAESVGWLSTFGCSPKDITGLLPRHIMAQKRNKLESININTNFWVMAATFSLKQNCSKAWASKSFE